MVMMMPRAAGTGFEIAAQRLLLRRRKNCADLLLDVGLRRAVLLCGGENRPQLHALCFGEVEIGERLQRLLSLRADTGV